MDPTNQVNNLEGKPELIDFMKILSGPKTLEQQNQILELIKSNPPLVAASIKQRQIQALRNDLERSADQFQARLNSIRGVMTVDPNLQPQELPSVQAINLQQLRQEQLQQNPNQDLDMAQQQQHKLPNEETDRFAYNCNLCKTHIETRYHCTVCDDFDLCLDCKEKKGHPHKMEILGLVGSMEDTKPDNVEEARKFSVQRCIQSLVHACQCKNVNCQLASCQRMKRVVQHIKTCRRRTSGGCPICKQLVALCCHHARRCQEAMCFVPFCSNLKQKIKQATQQSHVKEEKMLRQGIALLKLTEPEDSAAASSADIENLLEELNLVESNPNN